ncbi:hypothetical protein EIP91_009810 [Steccherinum ochraceum]|uniref:Uncharacterized protein n=1 Tax=Steccherinum ochraceum TaxID=92696 RepID=A0A4R0RMF5_9APHY|nr:hypothetical protein EIP91_009810 [Steccherinum ochraceum]
MFSVLSLVLLICQLLLVQATIYVTSPLQATTCHGGQPCTVQWLDNGEAPFLSDIGPCHVGLYNGRQVLVQQLDPVDVGATHSFVFTPDSNAGPDSGTYYVNFTSINPVKTTGKPYNQFSTFFKLADMAGSLSSPIASDTSTHAVPSSIAHPTSNSVQTTVTVTVTPTPSSAVASGSGSLSSDAVPSHSLSLSFSAGSSSPTAPLPTTATGTIPTGSASGSTSSGASASSSAPSTTPTPTSLPPSSTSLSVPPTSLPGSSTLTVPPTSSGFLTSRTSTTLVSPSVTNPSTPSNVSSAGFLDSKPSQRVSLVVFSMAVSALVGGCNIL